MRPNEVLSPAMHVKPLKAGEKATFRLITAGLKEVGRELPSYPEVYMLSDRETVYDAIAGKSLLIGNVVSMQPLRESGGGERKDSGGNVIYAHKTVKPEFIRGVLEVTADENDKYQYLMRNNGCKDNQFRKRTAKIKYELVSQKKEVSDALMIEDIQDKAGDIIRHGEWDQLKAIREKLNKSPDARMHIKTEDLQGIKLELRKMAKTFPKQVIAASGDTKALQTIHVYDAMLFQVLIFQEGKWFFNSAAKEKYQEIHTVPPNEEKVESLVELFQKEGGPALHAKIATELGKILKATQGG